MTSTLSQIIHRRQFIITALATTACSTARKNAMDVDDKISLEGLEAPTTTNKHFSFTSFSPQHNTRHHNSPEMTSQILLYWGMNLFDEETPSQIPQPMTAEEQKRRYVEQMVEVLQMNEQKQKSEMAKIFPELVKHRA